ncbi:MAG: CHASE2 domain-containing protein [Flavobacteriaceae bacterium]
MRWRNVFRLSVERGIAMALLAALVVLRAVDPAPLELMRLKTFDLYQVFFPRKTENIQVMIVDIDEESLDVYGQWPWPRTVIANLVNSITELGAVAVAFDVIFAEHDRMSLPNLAGSIRGLDPKLQEMMREAPSNDSLLADAIAHSRVVLGQSGYHREVVKEGQTPVNQVPLATVGPDPRPYLFDFPAVIRNVPELERQAAGRGLVTIIPERDGIVRRVPTVARNGETIWPSLSIELLRVATGTNTLLLRSDANGVNSIVVAKIPIPTDENGRVWVHFSPHSQARYVSAADVLSAAPKALDLRGRLAIIGTSAVGLFDQKATPIDPAMPGAEVHAQLIENILSQRLLTRPGYAVGAEITLVVLIGLAIIVLVPLLGALNTLISGALIAAALAGLSVWLFLSRGFVFDVVYPLMSSGLVFLLMVFVNYFREEGQRRQIRAAFGQYLSPDFVEVLARNPEKLRLGGETKELTILFSDVRGFTSISEQYKDRPQELTHLINSLLTPLSDAVVANQGTIDKYMGDNVMAFWNAPLDDADHAAHGCRAALDMLSRLGAVNDIRRKDAEEAGAPYVPLVVGVGVNTGEVVVGNMGSDQRFDYTVLGDAVNLGSRLEGQTKTYGLLVIIGSRTAELVKGRFAVLPVDRIRVKGKAEPEPIYTILRDPAALEDPDYATLLAATERLFEAYRGQKWQAAAKIVSQSRELAAKFAVEGLFDVYGERIAQFRKNPPPRNWDGVFVATSK